MLILTTLNQLNQIFGICSSIIYYDCPAFRVARSKATHLTIKIVYEVE
jgi:hypothetical protein